MKFLRHRLDFSFFCGLVFETCCLFMYTCCLYFVFVAVSLCCFFSLRLFELALIVYAHLLLAVVFILFCLAFAWPSFSQEAMIQECVRAGFLKRNNLSGLILMDCARLEKVRSVGMALITISRRLVISWLTKPPTLVVSRLALSRRLIVSWLDYKRPD